MAKTTVIINCQSRGHISHSLLKVLAQQSVPLNLEIRESHSCPNRLSEIAKTDADFLFFLDQDVVLQSPDSLNQIQIRLSQIQQPCLMTGLYLSSEPFTYLQKAYNWLTNQWILLDAKPMGKMKALQNAAGGIWAIKKSNFVELLDWEEPTDWGGEDTRAIRYLKQKGVLILQHPQLNVFHMSARDLKSFIRRAFRQGQARERWSLKSRRRFDFFRNQGSMLNSYLPAWLTHSFFVGLGAWFEKIKSWNPLIKPHSPPIK